MSDSRIIQSSYINLSLLKQSYLEFLKQFPMKQILIIITSLINKIKSINPSTKNKLLTLSLKISKQRSSSIPFIKQIDHPFKRINNIQFIRKMSLLNKNPKENAKIKELETLIYEPYKTLHCSEHHLTKQITCLTPNCPMQLRLMCKDCHPSNSSHSLISVHKLVPKLAQFLKEEWALILRDHKIIENEWKHCLVNVNYCLQILGEIKSQIEERSQKVVFNVFNQLLDEVYSMFKHQGSNLSPEMLLSNFARLNKKYNLIQSEDKPATCASSQEERIHNQKQVKQVSSKTKIFSQSALAFSEQLALIIEERFKMEKRVSKLKQLTQNRIFTLKDLVNEKDSLEEVGEVMIDVTKQKKDSQQIEISSLLEKCQNLKSLRIANKGGLFDKNKWKPILNGMEYLKYLRELVLNIQASDLKPLTELFKEKNKAVRQIQRLTLQITDQKQLNVKQVCDFLNTMELRGLQLTLTRDNLSRQQMVSLLKNVRLCTSMSQLPLGNFVLNVSKNKVKQGPEIIEVTNLFHHQAHKIKEKSLII